MADKRQYEFFLLRYVPDPIKDEFVNIGVALLGSGEDGYVKVQMSRDWRRVLCMDADADLELLDALGRDLELQLSNLHDRAAVIKSMQESFSGAIQLSPIRGCLAEQPEAELETMAKLYLDSRHLAHRQETSARRRILRIMQDEFERAGVWKLMQHHIPVAEYTVPGDPLKIDCGYRPNGTMKMFHAVPLATNIDLAKILAFTYPMIVQGLRDKNLAAELTAIVDTLDRKRTEVAFALHTLEQSGISLAITEEMPMVADRVRQELRA